MPTRFRKTVTIMPGVKVNLSKGGMSFSLGRKGLTINIGKHGRDPAASYLALRP